MTANCLKKIGTRSGVMGASEDSRWSGGVQPRGCGDRLERSRL